MSEAITSDLLLSNLNHETINEVFEMVYKNRTGILATATMGSPVVSYDGYKMGWLDTQIEATQSDTTAAATDSATTVNVVDGSKFRAGMTVSAAVSKEVMLVTAVTSNALTVTRGFGGTTAESIADETAIIIDSVGREENSLAANDGIYQPVKMENHFQTMDTNIEMSRRALATLQYGNSNDLNFQLQVQIKQLATQLDRALVRGRKAVATISGKDISYTGGLRYFLEQTGAINTSNGASALTLDHVNALNAQIVAAGGTANTIAVGITLARKLNALVSSNYNSQRLADWTADEGSVLRLPSDLPLVGNVNTIVVDTNLDDDELIIYDNSMLSIVPMAANNADASGAWRTLDSTANGQDGQSVRIIGDFAIEARQSKTHMARLYNIGS